MAQDHTRQLFNRLRYIEGQAQGIRRMLLGGRAGAEVLVQLRAIESAAAGARELYLRHQIEEELRDELRQVVESHLQTCLGGDDLRGWLAGDLAEETEVPPRRRRKPKAAPAETDTEAAG